jgi:hypothetical protein
MNSHSRLDLLAKSMARAAQKAETSKEYPQCPNCGQVLEGWRPSEETSGTDNDDPENEGDGVDGADQDKDEFDNLRPIDRLNSLTRNLASVSNKGSTQR